MDQSGRQMLIKCSFIFSRPGGCGMIAIWAENGYHRIKAHLPCVNFHRTSDYLIWSQCNFSNQIWTLAAHSLLVTENVNKGIKIIDPFYHWWWWGGGGQLLRVFGGCDWVTGHWTPLLNPGNWSFPDTSTCSICFTCICQCIPWFNSICHQNSKKIIFWFSEVE